MAVTDRLSGDDRLSFLLGVADLLRAEVDLDTLLGKMVDLIAESMQGERATVYVVDPRTGELLSKVAHLPELAEIRLAPGQGVAGHVAATGEPVLIPQAAADERFFGGVDAQTGYETRSMIAVPVRRARGGELLGVVQVLNRKDGNVWTESDVRLLEVIASQVATVLAETPLAAHKPAPSEITPEERSRPPARYNKILGDSPAMQRVYELIANAATTDATVLVRGESGTGKELVARAIHTNSPRAQGPFVKLDCTTIPEGLMESELFGHERGAFTGAERQVQGKAELADRGTLFLDEIGDLPSPLQGKLLRILQDREFERVGGRKTLRVDVRIVAATNRDLAVMVARGQFRQDLYYRLKVVELELPPLRTRGSSDIDLLAQYYLELYARKHGRGTRTFSPQVLGELRRYTWPGNVRELEHTIERAVVVAGAVPQILPEHLGLPEAVKEKSSPETLALATLADVEKRHILKMLDLAGGNRTKAAQLLDIGRNTLQRKLKEYGIE
jgi:Nif-specific regulatory protein